MTPVFRLAIAPTRRATSISPKTALVGRCLDFYETTANKLFFAKVYFRVIALMIPVC